MIARGVSATRGPQFETLRVQGEKRADATRAVSQRWRRALPAQAAAGPLRPLMQLSSNTIVNCTDGHKLVVSMCERENKTQGLLRCDVTGMNIWSPAVYPNASQPDGGGGDALDAANCTTGCLW